MPAGPLVATTGGPFSPGAPLVPADALRAWLDAQRTADGAPRLTRLPLVLVRADVGYALRGARVGAAPDALVVDVNDGALGVGLADRARSRGDATCAFLVEGYWRGEEGGRLRYDVVRAGQRPLTPGELAAVARADVEVAGAPTP